MPESKTAFVTGGTGFVGLNLVEQLTQSGWEVVALHRPSSDVTHLRSYPVRLVEGAIEDRASLDRAMPEDADAVFHVAGDVSLWSGHKARQWKTNVEGTRNMVAAALAKRCRKFVHTSSTAVFGIPQAPFDESSPKLGKGSLPYQHSKALAEEEVAKAVDRGLDAVLLNPANVIGRYDWGTWSQFIRLAANRKLLRIPPGSACYADVGAVAKAHLTAVDKGRSGENYILGGPRASYYEVVQLIGRLLRQPTNRGVGRPAVFRFAGNIAERISLLTGREPAISRESAAIVSGNIVCSSDKAARELGYRPASLEAMFKDCIDWMVAEDLIRPRPRAQARPADGRSRSA